jgi:dihydrofolate reductase
MGRVISEISMSLDGFVAGPNPTVEEPLGERGEELHEWVVKLASWRKSHGLSGGETNADSEIVDEYSANKGAVVMGRRMFSGGEGSWDDDPQRDGWWGDNPPSHVPVFILTHHEREKEVKEGGTTFNFVTNGVASALKQAKAAAGGKDVLIAGGANVIQQFLNAGFIDEIQIHVVPILLSGGTRLLDKLDPKLRLEKTSVIDSPAVTHLKFRVTK